MTVSIITSRVQYDGDGIETNFIYPFKVYEDDDIRAIKTDANGLETTLIINSQYTVSGAGNDSGGSITLINASDIDTNETLTILRDIDFTQDTDYSDGSTTTANDLERPSDKSRIIEQQIKEVLDRTLELPVNKSVTNKLPPPEALKIFRWNSEANAVEYFEAGSITLAIPADGSVTAPKIGPGVIIRKDITSIAALRSEQGELTDIAYVPGYYTSSYTGGGHFYWDSTSTETDDGGAIIKVTAVDTGRWKRIFSGDINVLEFGAKLDGTTDDSTVFQNADAFSNGGIVVVPYTSSGFKVNTFSATSMFIIDVDFVNSGTATLLDLNGIIRKAPINLEGVASTFLPVGDIEIIGTFNNTLGAEIYNDGTAIQYKQFPYDLIDFTKFTTGVTDYYVNYALATDAGAGTATGAGGWKTLDYAITNAVLPAVIHIEDDWTGYLSSGSAGKIANGALKIIGEGASGRTIIVAQRESYTVGTFSWASSGGSNAYVSSTGSAKFYRAQFDGNYRDAEGFPRPIIDAGSQAACETTPGTYFWNGVSSLYVHMHDGRIPDMADGWLVGESPYDFEIQQTGNASTDVILLENLEFINNNGTASGGAAVRYRPVTTGTPGSARFGMKNCLIYGASSNGVQVYDADICVMEDCHAAYVHVDGFNYHSFVTTGTKGEFITVYEHNCSTKHCGFDLFADQAALSTSSNGSTSHDSMHIIRTNGFYAECNGAVIADVNGVHSLNYKVQVAHPVGTASPKACFWHEAFAGVGTTKKMYLWGCSASDDGDNTVNILDNTAQGGGAVGDIHVKYWLGQTDGTIVGDIKDFDGNIL